jgi:hypothetical protein
VGTGDCPSGAALNHPFSRTEPLFLGGDLALDRSFLLRLILAILHFLCAAFASFTHENFLSFSEGYLRSGIGSRFDSARSSNL